jgi:hypothetical protein
MHKVLVELENAITEVIASVNGHITHDDAFNKVHNWHAPGVSKTDLLGQAESLLPLINTLKESVLSEQQLILLVDYPSRLIALAGNLIPNLPSNPPVAIPPYFLTFQTLHRLLESMVPRGDQQKLADGVRDAGRQLKAVQARLNTIDPRSSKVSEMIAQIESVHQAASQLPEDLESLADARNDIAELLRLSTEDQGKILQTNIDATDVKKQLVDRLAEAESVLKRCDAAYSAATSVGLAAAFAERSKALNLSMWVWVVFLLASLAFGSIVGGGKLADLNAVLGRESSPGWMIALNILVSLLAIGAPVWFAWLSTKQIGHRFKMAEDYGYKASISQAYEGFRREAARFDKEMEARLLTTAFARLDELPLRLVERETYGSPWHEFASSDLVKGALKATPNFTDLVRELATKVQSVALPVAGVTSVAIAAALPSTATEDSAGSDEAKKT